MTVCTRDRECLFGHVLNGDMRLNHSGEIARRCWEEIPRRFPSVVLDSFAMMPNHVHGIIVIKGESDASSPPLRASGTLLKSDSSLSPQGPNGSRPGALSAVVQNFKSISTRRINVAHSMPGTPIWQRGHREHFVRHEQELTAIREYIQGNPACWDEDENNPTVVNR